MCDGVAKVARPPGLRDHERVSSAAGYSGTPLARKLGIKEGHRVALLHAPRGFRALLEGLPSAVGLVDDPRGKGPYDVVVLFVPDQASLRKGLARAAKLTDTDGALWVSWPKKSSPLFKDLTEDGIRAVALPTGLVDVKVCAVDQDWSGLKLVLRLEKRPSRG
jgi:hypothetical protein